MEGEPNTTEQKEKKDKRPLHKKMEELKQLGYFVEEYESKEWNQCNGENCFEQAKWYIEGNSYCDRCMSSKVEEFKKAREK